MSEVEIEFRQSVADVYLDDPYGPLPPRWVRQPLWEERDDDFITKAFHYIRSRATGQPATVLPKAHIVNQQEKSAAEIEALVTARLERTYRPQIEQLNGHIDRQRTEIARRDDELDRQRQTIEQQRQQIEKQRQEFRELQAKIDEERVHIEHSLTRVAEVAQSVRTQHKQLVGEIQLAVRELAMMVASRVVYQKIEADDEAIVSIVRHVASRLETADSIVVKLHPEDLALLQRRLHGKALPLEHGTVEVEADPSLKRGDCTAVAGELAVMSRIQEQIADLRKAVMAV